MALLPERHPNQDLFVLDVTDAAPRDDMVSMEHPFYSLSTKPDMRELKYENGNVKITIVPSGRGLPTIFDKDIIIFCISQLIARKNQGLTIGQKVQFSGREFLVATNRPTNDYGYKSLEDTFVRLNGTRFFTTAKTGDKRENKYFGLINEAGFVYNEKSGRLEKCEVVLSDWIFRAINNFEVLKIEREYFRLRRPLERRIYEIARKHCGNQKAWQISLKNLQSKTGSISSRKYFRYTLRNIIKDDHTPGYRLELDSRDMVTVRPRKPMRPVTMSNDIKIPAWAEEMAREIAHQKGWDFYALQSEWLEFARKSGTKLDNPGAAFVGFCKKKEDLR